MAPSQMLVITYKPVYQNELSKQNDAISFPTKYQYGRLSHRMKAKLNPHIKDKNLNKMEIIKQCDNLDSS